MSLLDKINSAQREAARNFKAFHVNHVATCDRGHDTDMPHSLCVWRADGPVAIVQAVRGDPMDLAALAHKGFTAEVTTLTTEAWYSPLPQNPVTGKPWADESTNFRSLTDEHNALENGWLQESLVTLTVDWAGNLVAKTQVYQINGSDVEWMGTHDPEMSPFPVDLFLASAFRSSTAGRPDLPGKIHADLDRGRRRGEFWPHASAEELRAKLDLATKELIQDEFPAQVMLRAEKGTLRQAILTEEHCPEEPEIDIKLAYMKLPHGGLN